MIENKQKSKRIRYQYESSVVANNTKKHGEINEKKKKLIVDDIDGSDLVVRINISMLVSIIIDIYKVVSINDSKSRTK